VILTFNRGGMGANGTAPHMEAMAAGKKNAAARPLKKPLKDYSVRVAHLTRIYDNHPNLALMKVDPK
jgi:hypothetical protein